jgi:competence protein ComEA
MLRKLLATIAAFFATSAFAAVEVNKAAQAELERVPGVGTATASQIVSERKKREFKDWNDLVVRIQGVGDRSAAKFSEGGLTVNGKTYPGPTEPSTVPRASTPQNLANAKGAKTDAGARSPATQASAATADKRPKSAAAAKTAETGAARSAAASAAKK